jgi:antibiotic biosynthesis monooxygenase (ABM) superfamily enzyme
MVYNQVVYLLHPGNIDAYLDIEQQMKPLVEKAGYRFIGSWRTTIGNMNEFTSIFAIEDMDHLQKAGAAMMENKEYVALAKKLASISTSYTTKVMRATPASPLK